MNKLDQDYQNLLDNIYWNGVKENNRTGIAAYTIPSAMIQHDMSTGFPMLTIKKVPFKTMAVELEGFIKGISSKKWFQDRGCRIWDSWCNPQKVPYGHDEETKKKMLEEDDLGLLYGKQWRDFHDPSAYEYDYMGDIFFTGNRIDQLKNIINTLKTDPGNRRMICSAWNPLALDQMALPPCHLLWQISVIGNKLNLNWYQRSVDAPLGLGWNIPSYGLLLHLLAKESGYEEGMLTGFLSNVHIYENQLDGVEEILKRKTEFELPNIQTPSFTNIFDWQYTDSILENYHSLAKVTMPVAV